MRRLLTLWWAVAAMLAAGCVTLPPLDDRAATTALADTAHTRLGRAVAPGAAAHPGRTGVHAVPAPRDAFAARVLLAAAAEASLDVQYYLWHADESGTLMAEALWNAAERGVRVRLLLDDLNTRGLDAMLAALDAHPRIEVRLYNPFAQRRARALAVLADFERANRRMHNKSFTADNQVSIVGGRNVGNEYFGAGGGVVFADLDLIAVGAAVRDVSRAFDLYWNSASAYPASSLLPAPPGGAAELAARFAAARARPEAAAFVAAVRTTPIVRDLVGGTLAFEWTDATVVHDDPAKSLGDGGGEEVLLFDDLVRAVGRPRRTLDLVSPYFVPGEAGTASLAAQARGGVRVRILTNSLASSDVTAVHAGYARRRVDLLAAGVRLYELKPTASERGEGGREEFGGSSSAALHAKTFAVDRARVFVGSFNFDPRSARLNTEMGLVVDSPGLATRLAEAFDRVDDVAYEVRLAPDGGLMWIERTAAGEVVHRTEPGTTWFRRAAVGMLSVLPIEWLLKPPATPARRRMLRRPRTRNPRRERWKTARRRASA